ncbi:MAG: polysaccharide biosynthesis tyrosine autokinase [Acidobacteria bacterium]|nr:polysaccharide biosynthesis tyrosine autokinase [Acidobacteriota bacterium]
MSNGPNPAPPKREAARPKPAAPGAAGPHYEIESEVHLLDRLAVLYRYRAIAITVFVLTTGAMLIQGYTAVPMYEARTRILIDDERSTAIPGLNQDNQFYEDPEPYYQTQYRILTGRDLVRRAVATLDLASVPEFNGTAAAPDSPAQIARELGARVMARLGAAKTAPAESPKPDETESESAWVDGFIDRLRVDPVRGSHLVDVSFTAMDPAFAAEAVNALAREYVDQNLQIKLETTRAMLEWLDKEVANQQKKVQDSEQALAEYRARENAMSLDEKQNIVVSRVNKLNEDVMMARTRKARNQVLYDQIRETAPADLPELPVIAQNPVVAAAKTKVLDAQRVRAQLSQRYGEKHPQMAKAMTDLQEAQRQYQLEVGRAVQAIRNDYETTTLEEQSFVQALNAAKADAQDLSNKSVDYNVMERETQSNRQVYEALLQRENELRVASNSQANNVRIVDTAEVPKGPTGTNGRSWPVALALGFVLATLVPFGLDYINDTVKTPEDVSRRLKLPFLGLVPSVRGDKHLVLASAHVPHDFGESFRSLRTALIGRYDTPETKLLVFTSAQPLEGKTTTAVNIAMALAYGGARVLVIDADMRRPGLHRPLRLANERGLSQVLSGQARVRDVIQRTVDPNLLAITAGRTPPNPSELLTSERMKTLLRNLSHGPFDWIILDTPPVLAVTDAVVLAPLVSGVTFVVGAEMTRRRLAERALETILATHPKQVGVVLNKVDFARNKYYYSRYYGHQYKNYYAEAAS